MKGPLKPLQSNPLISESRTLGPRAEKGFTEVTKPVSGRARIRSEVPLSLSLPPHPCYAGNQKRERQGKFGEIPDGSVSKVLEKLPAAERS